MTQFMLSFLTTSAVMTLIILIVLVFRAVLPETFSPKLRYMVWVIILVGLVIPLRPIFGGGLLVFDLSTSSLSALEPQLVYPVELSNEGLDNLVVGNIAAQDSITQNEVLSSRPISIFAILTAVWLFVAISIFIYHIWRYIRFSKLVKRWGNAVTDSDISAVFHSIKAEKGLAKKNIGLVKCDFVSTSMLVGFLRPVVVLPEKEFDADELGLIFRHELIHYKRCDLYIKLLSVLAVSLNWFNPAVYLMSAAMQADCEASCDEGVLLEVGGENRRFYAELIMEMIGDKKPATLLSTCFYGSEQGIKIRMGAILSSGGRTKKIAFAIPILLITLTIFSGSVFAFSQTLYEPYRVYQSDYFANEDEEISDAIYPVAPSEIATPISAVEARDIALAEVGGGIFEGLYYDFYLGVFRIEILQDDTRLYLAVDSVSGDVMIYRRGER